MCKLPMYKLPISLCAVIAGATVWEKSQDTFDHDKGHDKGQTSLGSRGGPSPVHLNFLKNSLQWVLVFSAAFLIEKLQL